jgi:hypothetical protein
MSITAKSIDATIGRILPLECRGDLNSSHAVSQQSELNDYQKTKVEGILKEPCSDIQRPIVAVSGEENTVSAAPSCDQAAPSIVNALYSDIMQLLFNSCFSVCDFATVTALACLNKHWYTHSTNFWVGRDLRDIKQLCPELTILDAKAQGVKCEDEPKISKPLLLKWAKELSPHVEDNAGVTQLTMPKGTTLNQLIQIAKAEGMTVHVLWDSIIQELGDVPVEQTYGILITNSVFSNSRSKAVNLQNKLVRRRGCQMPTVQEYIALLVFTYKAFKKCLYGHNPSTFARSSTRVEDSPLVVGDLTSTARFYLGSSNFSDESRGAGGQRKF